MSDDDEDDLFTYIPARSSDPDTSHIAARSIKRAGIMWKVLRHLSLQREPRNGWEISKALEMQTITAVPRLAPLRRQQAIRHEGPDRPGPTGHGQGAYVITDKGRQILAHEVELQINPPFHPWEIKGVLQDFLWRALNDGWTDELRAEVATAFVGYRKDEEIE